MKRLTGIFPLVCHLLLGAAVLVASSASAGVKAFGLDNVYADHMVLQRNRPIRLVGYGVVGDTVTAQVGTGAVVRAAVARNGRFTVELPAQPAGGPYDVIVRSVAGCEAVQLSDVMVGDVWICSGQSNMQFYMWHGAAKFFHLPDGDRIAAAAKDRKLRLLQVRRSVSPHATMDELAGDPVWHVGDEAEAIEEFSAVAYLFGAELRKSLADDVPIGLVATSWGGTKIEPWIPLTAFLRSPACSNIVKRVDAARKVPSPAEAKRLREEYARKRAAAMKEVGVWLETKFYRTAPEASAEALANWAKPDLDVASWRKAPLSQMLGLSSPGVAWYRFEADLPASWAGAACTVHFDSVNDTDETFFDGVKIGATGLETASYWSAPRNYAVTVAKGGRHVIAVRAADHFSRGGFGSGMWIRNDAKNERVAFGAGDVFEKIEFRASTDRIGVRPSPPDDFSADDAMDKQFPTTLWNAMVAPLADFNVAGVIWYQGCSNEDDPEGYRIYERLQIDSWRRAFRDPKLPFLVTQLAAYYDHRPANRLPDDFWKDLPPGQFAGFAPLRLVQLEMLDCPQAGVACTIDVGDHSDIHPPDKKTVAKRLVHEALRIRYGANDRLPGPRGTSARREGVSVAVTVRDAGRGLEVRGGKVNPHLFALKDAKGDWRWADAVLRKDGTLLVTAADVTEPVAVQYCHQPFPPAPNLYRLGDGLPLFPFSLDVCRSFPVENR